MLTVREHESGLVLAEEAWDETRLSHALKQIRPDVALQKRPRDEGKGGTWVYKVVHIPTGEVMFTWMDERGNPLPLSSGLVDEFQRHQVGARNGPIDADEANRRHLEQLDRQQADRAEAVWDDWRPRLRDGRVQVSMAPSVKRRRGRR